MGVADPLATVPFVAPTRRFVGSSAVSHVRFGTGFASAPRETLALVVDDDVVVDSCALVVPRLEQQRLERPCECVVPAIAPTRLASGP